MDESCFVRETACQTLTLQDAQFNLGHIEPRTVFGRVMELQLFDNPPRLCRGERFIKGSRLVRVQVVHDDANDFCLRVKGREVLAGKKVDTKSLPVGVLAFQEALQKYYGETK